MGSARLDRWGAAAGLVTWAAAGIFAVRAEPPVAEGSAWWAPYLAFGALFAATASDAVERRAVLGRALLALQVFAGLATVLAEGGRGFAAALLVLSAATGAFLLGFRPALALAGGQSGALALAVVSGQGGSLSLVQVLVYGGFQLFAVLMVESGLREARARAAVAALNVDLVAARARLAESSRTEERLSISRDLHDLIGHQLTALTLELEAAAHLASGPAAEHVGRARSTARELLTDVRAVVGRLREPPFDLGTALRRVGAAVAHPAVHVDLDPGCSVDDPSRALALLRCVQEIVTNTVRHARAEHLWIEISHCDGDIVVRARDDGRGVDGIQPGNGLRGMAERLGEFGGRVTYASRRGQGFTVEARVPPR